MLTLYITRHGETVWNSEGRMQGWLDSPLTEQGEKNAVSLGERLRETPLDAIYSSPSGRTMQTANLIRGNRDIPIFYDEQLKEIHLGDWEGMTHSEIEGMYPSEYEWFWKAPHLYGSVGGETFQQTRERAAQILNKIKEEQASGNILIVTHAVVIKCLFSIFNVTPIEQIWDPPFIHGTSLTIVETPASGYKIVLEGDLTHQAEVV